MERAWQRAEEACKLLETLRRIPRHVSMSFSVGLVGEDGDEAVAIPYPYGKDLTGIIFWRYKDTQRRYTYSQGIKIEMPFAMPRAVVTPPPTFIVEGAFDCMSLYAVGRGAVATLGTRSIIAALDVLQSFNPTMVRLRHGDKGAFFVVCEAFQSHNGAIATKVKVRGVGEYE
jgi:hypothetical protein